MPPDNTEHRSFSTLVAGLEGGSIHDDLTRAVQDIMWFYQLFQPEKSFDDAFDEACNKAKVETKLPLFYGSPEA